MLTIKRKVCIWLLFLLSVPFICPDVQFMDVVLLKDGRSLEGLIIDRLPGNSVKLETPGKTVLTFEMDEIEIIESRKSDDSIKVRNVDAVFLNGGVVFKGTIVRQVPDISITLETDTGLLIPFPSSDIWKILTIKRIEGDGDYGTDIENEVAGFKISLQVDIEKKILEKIKQPGAAEKDQDNTDLGKEIDQLTEEVEALQDLKEKIELENNAKRNAEISEEIDALEKEIEELLDKLIRQAEECESLDEVTTESDVSLWKGGKTKKNSPNKFIRKCQSDKTSSEKTSSIKKTLSDKDLEVLENQFSLLLDDLSERTVPPLLDEEINVLKENTEELSTRVQLGKILGRGILSLDTRINSYWMVEKLSLENRLYLYESYKRRDQLQGVILNSVPFLYIGSWVQGDKWGAWTGYGFSLLSIGIVALLDDVNGQSESLFGGQTNLLGHDENGYYIYRDFNIGGLLAVIGILSIPYAHSLIRPVRFVNRYNRKLGEFLELEKSQIRRELSALTLNPPTIGIALTSENELRVQVKLLSLQY